MFKPTLKSKKDLEKDKMLKSSPQFIIYYFAGCEFVASAEADNEKEAINELVEQKIDTRFIDFQLVCNRKNDTYYASYFNPKKPNKRVFKRKNQVVRHHKKSGLSTHN